MVLSSKRPIFSLIHTFDGNLISVITGKLKNTHVTLESFSSNNVDWAIWQYSILGKGRVELMLEEGLFEDTTTIICTNKDLFNELIGIESDLESGL